MRHLRIIDDSLDLCIVGFCFQFNSDGKLNATSAGKTGGISIMLNAVVDDYFTGPRSYSEGFSVSMFCLILNVIVNFPNCDKTKICHLSCFISL